MVEDLVIPGIAMVIIFAAAFVVIVTYRQLHKTKILPSPPTVEELTEKAEKELCKIDKYIDSIGG